MTYVPPQVPLNLAVADPQLPDVLAALRTSVMLGLNCHAVGTVRSFGEGVSNGAPTGMYVATVTVDYVQTFFERQADGTYLRRERPYPPVVDAPALMLGGGLTQLTMPVAPGDPCLILFNDRDLNNWYAGARGAPVATPRAHSFSDALVLVGFARTSRQSSTHALLTNGSAEVGVPASGAAQVRIANNLRTLAEVLGQLIDAVEGITVLPGTFNIGGTSVTGVSGAVSSTVDLEAARAAVDDLLE